jgi:hypothetical protein
MGLSLRSVYGPLNDFFLERFGTPSGSPVVFRFDKFGSGLSDADFTDASRPELGLQAALAQEKFSELVNRVPVDAGDGMNVGLAEDSVDATYFDRLLSPSMPCVGNGTDEAARQALVDAFNALKARAMRVWGSVKLESSSGLMLQYRPSVAMPEEWYDSAKDGVWTRHSFEVGQGDEPATPTAAPAAPPPELWRLRPSDAAMARVLEVDGTAAAAAGPAARLSPARLEAVAAGSHLHGAFRERLGALDLKERIVLKQCVEETAPTRPAQTSRISVAFDYCLVRVRRPWLVDTFLRQPGWCVPATAKGTCGLALLPIGFVAIRRLEIHGDWTAEDVASASSATDFGPFSVTPRVAGGTLEVKHRDLQVIGWILQALPALPPDDGPTA